MIMRLVITGFLLLMATGCSSGPQLGHTVPPFDAIDSNGESLSLASYDDQVLILYFFGVW